MANNYSVTSYTLRSAAGTPAILGPIGLRLFSNLPGDGWFSEATGTGIYDGCCDFDSLLDILDSDSDDFDPERDIAVSLKALGATDAMIEVAAGWNPDFNLSVDCLYELARLEPGACLHSLALETGFWCDKNRHGEFGGYGCYISPAVVLEEGSQSALSIGADLEEALGLDNPAQRVAGILKKDLLDPILKSLSDDVRDEVLAALKDLL